MSPDSVKEVLRQLVAASETGTYLVPFLHGGVGAAKSAVVAQVAKELTIQFLDLRLSNHETVDVTGVPSVVDGRTIFNPPGWLPRDGKGILFLDELPQASVPMQNVAGQIIYDRKWGTYTLPPGWIVVIAGNRLEDRAGTTRTPQQINNRVIHINMDPDFLDWKPWALDNGVNPLLVAFLEARQELLHKPSPDKQAFPTLRTWAMANDVLALELPEPIRNETLMGTVGEGAAGEFISFLRTAQNIPSWKEVLRNPKRAGLPEGSAATYALMENLARRVTFETLEALTLYLPRMHNDDMANLCMSRAAKITPALTSHPAYTAWVLANRI